MQRSKLVVTLVALICTASVVAANAADIKGMITSRTGDTLTVKSADTTTTVVLTDDTRTKDNMGLFGLDRKEFSNSVLIPGLKVDIDGSSDEQGRVVAKTITVDGDDLEASQMIQSGLHPTAEQVAANVQTLQAHEQRLGSHEQNISENRGNIAANQQNISANKAQIEQNIKDTEENTNRFLTLADYDVKDQTAVKFNVGSSTLDAKDKADLKQLAQNAAGLKGYLVEVIGYADSTGSAAINTKLSEDRAKSVITFLVQQCGIPPRYVVAPGAMGEYGPTASNETKTGRAENRRVEVKVLLNKGIAGS